MKGIEDMGFRSTMTTGDTGLTIPQWFVDNHPDCFVGVYGDWAAEEYQGKPKLPISYRFEHKYHSEVIEDLQKALVEDTKWSGEKIELVLFHECDGITKVRISKDKIQYFEPQEWEEVNYITHNYCYNCSTPKTSV